MKKRHNKKSTPKKALSAKQKQSASSDVKIIEQKVDAIANEWKDNESIKKWLIKNAIIAKDLEALQLTRHLKAEINVQNIFDKYLVQCVVQDDKVDILKYLIEELKFDLKGSKDVNNNTLLDIAVLYGSAECTKLLLKHGFDVNHENSYGFSPMLNAIGTNHHDIALILVQNNADFEPDLPMQLIRYEYTKSIELIKAFAKKNNWSEEKQAKEIKAYKFPSMKVKVEPRLKITKPEEWDPFFAQVLCDWSKIILDKKYELFPQVIKNAKTQITSKLAKTTNDINELLNILKQVFEIYKSPESDSLASYILDCFDKVNAPALEQFYFCGQIIAECLNKRDVLKAAEYGPRILKNLPAVPAEFLELKGKVLYELGKIYTDIDLNTALEYSNQALEFLPNDKQIIALIYDIHRSLGNFYQAEEVANNIEDPALKLLTTIWVRIQTGQSIEKLLAILEANFSADSLTAMRVAADSSGNIYRDILIEQNKHIGNIAEAINICQTSIELHYKTSEFKLMHIRLSYALDLFKQYGQWTKGCDFLDNMYAKYPNLKHHNHVPLKFYEYIFYIDSSKHFGKAEAIVNYFHEQALKHFQNIKRDALLVYELAINKALIANNTGKLSHYLKCLEQLPQDHKIQLLKGLIETHFERAKTLKITSIPSETASEEKAPEEKLTKSVPQDPSVPKDRGGDNEKEEVIEEKSLTKAQRVTFADIKLMIEAGDYETLGTVNQALLNKYFQYNKAELKKLKYQGEDKNISSIFSWNIGAKIYSSSSAEIAQCGDSNFYAAIDEKLLNSLDKVTLDKFIAALKNGIISRDHGQCGIKFISNKLIELKIMEDLRLYTTAVCQNTEGKYFILFNKIADHKEIERVAPKSKISFIILKDTPEQSPIETITADGSEGYEYYSHAELLGCNTDV
jgi:hypothetical protein